ncbi:hypothetical protein Tco_0674017, partial [Tanacetum coccineum]
TKLKDFVAAMESSTFQSEISKLKLDVEEQEDYDDDFGLKGGGESKLMLPFESGFVERVRTEDERPIVTVAKHRTVTLLPTSVPRPSVELSDSIEREFGEDASGSGGGGQEDAFVGGSRFLSKTVSGMEHEHLFAEFNVSAARHLSLSFEVRMRAKYNILEKRRWKSLAEERNDLLQVKDKEIEGYGLEAIEGLLRGEVASAKEHNRLLEQDHHALNLKVTSLESIIAEKNRELSNLETSSFFEVSEPKSCESGSSWFGLIPRFSRSYLAKKDASTWDVMDLLRLDDVVAEVLGVTNLQPDVSQLMVPVYCKQDKVLIGSQALSVALDICHGRARKMERNLIERLPFLKDVFVSIDQPLFSGSFEPFRHKHY